MRLDEEGMATDLKRVMPGPRVKADRPMCAVCNHKARHHREARGQSPVACHVRHCECPYYSPNMP